MLGSRLQGVILPQTGTALGRADSQEQDHFLHLPSEVGRSGRQALSLPLKVPEEPTQQLPKGPSMSGGTWKPRVNTFFSAFQTTPVPSHS